MKINRIGLGGRDIVRATDKTDIVRPRRIHLDNMRSKKVKEILFWETSRKYLFLDNFYPSKFVVAGKEYKSVEHYYQSKKAKSEETEEWIRKAASAREAKRRGRSLTRKMTVKNWPNKKIMVMREAIYANFSQNPNLAKRLINTGDAVLHENSPDDVFWGVKGKDIMGKLLMKLRDKLRKQGR